MIGSERGARGEHGEPIGLKNGKTIPVTEGCACYTQGILEGKNGEEIDPEAYIQRCDTCEWIYDPAEEQLFDR